MEPCLEEESRSLEDEGLEEPFSSAVVDLLDEAVLAAVLSDSLFSLDDPLVEYLVSLDDPLFDSLVSLDDPLIDSFASLEAPLVDPLASLEDPLVESLTSLEEARVEALVSLVDSLWSLEDLLVASLLSLEDPLVDSLPVSFVEPLVDVLVDPLAVVEGLSLDDVLVLLDPAAVEAFEPLISRGILMKD